MYIAICDDLREELTAIEGLLQRWQTERRCVLHYRTYDRAEDLLAAAAKERFDLYLLDIMMPGTTGLEAAREIRGFDTAASIVFLTQSPGFAYESYGVRAEDYLLKPISGETLFPILDRLSARERRPQDGITLKCAGAYVHILFSQLAYVEVNGKHLYFTLIDGTVREVYGTLSEYADQLLDRPEFMQTHRSYIVNMLQVAEFSASGLTTFAGKNLPVSRRLYPQLQKDYIRLMFSRED